MTEPGGHGRRHLDDEAPVLGWREWVALPDLGVGRIKAKLDTGARTSSLHAFRMERFRREEAPWIRFQIHPVQRSTEGSLAVEVPVEDEREVRSSSGRAELRPVIRTAVELQGRRWPIELTLTRRDEMGFRMLLGRQALRGRALVDPGRSFLAGGSRSGSHPGRRSARRSPAPPSSDSSQEHP